MGRRTLLLIAALVVAALGTVLVFLYAQNAKNVAQQGQTLVKVLVAKTQITVGTSGATASTNGAFEQTEIPQSTVVSGALSDPTPLQSLVALVPIYPGQQIIGQQWGAVAQTNGLPLPAGSIAAQVQLGDPERVAGFVTPGSFVAIFVTGTQTTNGKPGGVARVLLPKVPVLAVGSTTVGQSQQQSGTSTTATETVPTAILTLALTQDEFQKILFVQKAPQTPYSGLTMALLDKNSKIDPNNTGTTVDNLFKQP